MSKYLIYSQISGDIYNIYDDYRTEENGDIIGINNGEEICRYIAYYSPAVIEITDNEFVSISKDICNYKIIDNEIIHINQRPIEEAKSDKITQLDNICTKTIYKGTDITLSTGETQHFTLDEQDQANLSGIGLQLASGVEMISWHQDDVTKPCEFYTAADAQTIINTLTVFKSYHITYFRDLRIYVNSLENVDDVEAIYYGYPLPDEAKSDVLKYYEGLIFGNVTDKAVE